jgi:hypothetical protein
MGHLSLNLPQASWLLGMTKGREALSLNLVVLATIPWMSGGPVELEAGRVNSRSLVGMTIHLWYLHYL